jgi:integrase
LAALKRAFRLGLKAECVGRVPVISLLREHNTRKGVFEPAQFRRLVSHLPESLRALFEVAHETGWRVKSELLTRTWAHVDFGGNAASGPAVRGWLRLEPGETKSRARRMFPPTPTLRAVLERQREYTPKIEHAQSRIIPWVFHRNGRPIRSFKKAWRRACEAAGCPGRIPHDFRRTAVRNLERAGVPRSAAMAMVGQSDRVDLPALRDCRRGDVEGWRRTPRTLPSG